MLIQFNVYSQSSTTPAGVLDAPHTLQHRYRIA
jgi:hypothetical protein